MNLGVRNFARDPRFSAIHCRQKFSVGADGETPGCVQKQDVEENCFKILAVVLPLPGGAPVLRGEDNSIVSDDPSMLAIGETYGREQCARWYNDLCPSQAVVARDDYVAVIAHRHDFFAGVDGIEQQRMSGQRSWFGMVERIARGCGDENRNEKKNGRDQVGTSK